MTRDDAIYTTICMLEPCDRRDAAIRALNAAAVYIAPECEVDAHIPAAKVAEIRAALEHALEALNEAERLYPSLRAVPATTLEKDQ